MFFQFWHSKAIWCVWVCVCKERESREEREREFLITLWSNLFLPHAIIFIPLQGLRLPTSSRTVHLSPLRPVELAEGGWAKGVPFLLSVLLPMRALLHRARHQALAFTNNGFITLKGDESDLSEIDFLTPADLWPSPWQPLNLFLLTHPPQGTDKRKKWWACYSPLSSDCTSPGALL